MLLISVFLLIYLLRIYYSLNRLLFLDDFIPFLEDA